MPGIIVGTYGFGHSRQAPGMGRGEDHKIDPERTRFTATETAIPVPA